jgi:serine/threonine-protein kinase
MGDTQRYHVMERIAAGGMAEVYRGESAGIEGFRKKVAIKRVLPKLSANREFIDMFLDEARLGAYLSHSRCVQVFDIGQGAGAHFIVMEYVDGADLKGVLDYLAEHNQLMPVEVACSITLGVCEGLAYAHQVCDHAGRPLEIVHRDISPHNVLMTRFGEVKLVDFGLAKASSHLSDEEEDIVKGKFGYLAPEVTLGQGADKRVDIFAAGILLWEMLTGRRLFNGATDLETFKLVRDANIPDPRQHRPEVPEEVVRVVYKALARNRDERYQAADDFARALSLVLARSQHAVTYQDIGVLVRRAADARDRGRKAQGKDQAGVIGDLIIDALHDFSDVPPEAQQSPLGTRGVEPSRADYVDPTEWGLDALFDESMQPAAPPPPPVATPAAKATNQRTDAVSAPRAAAPVVAPPTAASTGRAAAATPAAPSVTRKEGKFWRRWFGT